jgi:hypothetical protein
MKSQLCDIEIIYPDSPDCRLAGAIFCPFKLRRNEIRRRKTRFCGQSVSSPIRGHWLLYAAEGVPLPAVPAFRPKAFDPGADGARANHYGTWAKMRRDAAASDRLEGDVATECVPSAKGRRLPPLAPEQSNREVRLG